MQLTSNYISVHVPSLGRRNCDLSLNFNKNLMLQISKKGEEWRSGVVFSFSTMPSFGSEVEPCPTPVFSFQRRTVCDILLLLVMAKSFSRHKV